MMMKHISLSIFGLALLLTACGSGQSGDGASDEKSSALTQSIEDLDFENTFSPYVGVSTDKKYLRLSFGFFPDGSVYNTAASGKKVYVTFSDDGQTENEEVNDEEISCGSYCVMIPCDFVAPAVDLLSLGLSAPTEGSCQPVKYEFNGADEIFTVNGYVVPLNGSYNKFANDFGFKITESGFVDATSGDPITGEKLEEIYQKIITTADVD
ncbi:hypothetical protein K1X76_00795 [bacterium]|nr:hypothetical protein [bacterium]